VTPAANREGSGRRGAVLLRVAARLDDDLLQLPVDLRRGQAVVRDSSIPREDPMVGRDARGELRQDVALSPLGDHDACRTELGDVGGYLQGADRTARDENTFAVVGRGPAELVCGNRSRRAGEGVEPGNHWDGWGLEPAGRHHYSFE
jgi:hypothetical protein